MPTTNDDDKNKKDNVVKINGKEFKVTPEFKKEIEAEQASVTTKVKGLETEKLTLSQRVAELSSKPITRNDDDDGDDDERSIGFDDLMDRPEDAINKAVLKTLKKLGIDPTKVGDTSKIKNEILLEQHKQKYWDDFYREHSYFTEDEHDIFLKPLLTKMLPSIKDLPLKEGRKKIADTMASAMGRAIKGGKLEIATDPKHKPANGMQLESADGSTVDNDTDGDNTVVNERTGSMAEIVRNSPRSPYSTKKKVGTK